MIGVVVCSLAIAAALASVGVLMGAKVHLRRLAAVEAAVEATVSTAATAARVPAAARASAVPAIAEPAQRPVFEPVRRPAAAPWSESSSPVEAERLGPVRQYGLAMPVGRASLGRRLVPVAAVVVGLFSLSVSFVVWTRSPEPNLAGAVTSVPVAVATTGEGGATEPTPDPTGTEPTPDPTKTEPTDGAVDPASGLVVIGEGVDDSRAAAVAATLDMYFGGINDKDIDRVASVLDPAGGIDPRNPSEMSEFARATASVVDSQIVLESLSGPAGTPRATVSYQSNQSAGHGPRGRPGETCTRWLAVFTFRSTGGPGYLTDPKTLASVPC